MTVGRTLSSIALAAAMLLATDGMANAAATPAARAASPGSCTSSVRSGGSASTIYGVGFGGCTRNPSTLNVELRESRGSGYAVVSRAECAARSGATCTAITPRVLKRPGARYTVFVDGPFPSF